MFPGTELRRIILTDVETRNSEAQFDVNSVFVPQVHLYDLVAGRGPVWHSGIVAYGREYFYTIRGLVSVSPVRTERWEVWWD